MIVDRYQDAALHPTGGIEMSGMPALEDDVRVGAGWGRVPPGAASHAEQHDETETLVVVSGRGEVVVDGDVRAVTGGSVVALRPFETHSVRNTGDDDLVFATFYWRDPTATAGAAAAAARTGHRDRGDRRPVFVFSTPPTPNGDLHLGHLSGPYLAADAYVRHLRMTGVDAWHLTGSDDHQSYTADRARRDGVPARVTAARFGAEIAATLAAYDVDLDGYLTTSTDPTYADGLRAFFDRVLASGAVTARPVDALCSADSGRYLHEVDVSGGCPGCGATTGGNICEDCGVPNVCTDLSDPRESGVAARPVVRPVTRYAIDLPAFADEVAAHHRLGRVPARLRELADRVLSRTVDPVALTHPADWGVPPAGEAVPGQVIWVWPEMAYGFLHGIAALGSRLGRDWRADTPTADWKIVHFFGFDNSFYHAILYPVLYRLAHPGWTPDIDYHVNEFYLLDDEKFSTSRRHAVWGKEILADHGVDEVRWYLAVTRPEGRRTCFRRRDFETAVRDTLIGRWQRWLDGLGGRVAERYGGLAPDAGLWTPEHRAFQVRLGVRLAELTGALSGDGFSLNAAAAALDGIVADAERFAERESVSAGLPLWAARDRTAVALELAAARLLAHGAAAVMPRFAGRLAEALGEPAPTTWPEAVTPVPAGHRITLGARRFFGPEPAPAGPVPTPTDPGAAADLRAWLAAEVRTLLQLAPDAPVEDRPMAELGLESMPAVALQYQILERTGVDLPLTDLLGDRDLGEVAALLAERAAVGGGPPDAVASSSSVGVERV